MKFQKRFVPLLLALVLALGTLPTQAAALTRGEAAKALLSAALLLALLRASREAIGGVTAGLCLINLIPIFVCIAKTESALKKRFPD